MFYNKINLLNFKLKITRDPMRPINKFKDNKFNKFNTDKNLKNNFDDIVESFIEINNL
jgi:hypothetical protein